MNNQFSLRGEAIGRFRFLLEHDYPFNKAVQLAQQKSVFDKLLLDLALTKLKEKGIDVKAYDMIKANNTKYATQFRKGIAEQISRGRHFEDSLELAVKRADTLLSFSPGGNTSRPESDFDADPNVRKGTTEIRMAISKTNHPVGMINEKEFEMLRTNLLKHFEAESDRNTLPHFLQCTFFDKLGYVRLICADEKTVKWLTQALPKLSLWPNATLCIMREKTFKQSKAFCASFPDSVSDSSKAILGFLQSQNTGIDTTRWKVLSRQLQDDRTTVKLLLLMPAEPDRKIIMDSKYELNYKFSKVKFTTPNLNSAKTWGRVAFSATFPDSVGEKAEDMFKYMESQNTGMDASEWSVVERRKIVRDGKKEIQLIFVVDSCSAEIIRLAKNEINYKFTKVRLYPESLKRADEKKMRVGQQNYNPGRGTTLGKRPFQNNA